MTRLPVALACGLALWAAVYGAGPAPAGAQETPGVPDIQSVITREAAELQKDLEKISLDIDRATSALGQAASIDPNKAKEMVSEAFIAFKEQVTRILTRVGENGELVDALRRAKIAATRLLAWYRRQPADYPNRDDMIARLEASLKRFDEVDRAIQEQRAQANLTLIEIAQRYAAFERMKQVMTISQALAEVDVVVKGLKALNERLRGIADRLTQEGSGVGEQ